MVNSNVDKILKRVQELAEDLEITLEQKQELLQRLPSVLQVSASTSTPGNKNQSFSVGRDFRVDGTGAVVDASQQQIEAGRDVDASKRITVTAHHNMQQQDALAKLEQLQQQFLQSQELNAARKTVMDAPAEGLKKELSKEEPDKGLVKKFVEALQVGLGGVKTLAAPVAEVAKLVAAAWMII